MEDRWTEDRCTEDRCTEDQREKKTRLAVYADFHGIKMPAAVILYSDMDETSVFDRLAASLSREERKQVLAAIQLNIDQNLQPIQTGDVIPPPVAEQVQNLGLWGRIGLFLMRVFTRSEEEEIITRWTLNALRSRVRKEAGGKVDMTRELFLEPFAQDLDQLREVVSRCSTFIETVRRGRDTDDQP